jgi:hypothetical protein
MVLYLSSGVDFFLEMQPVGIRENHLLQRIIDADWRLNRVPFLQENLLKIGEFREAKRIRDAHPGADEQTVEVYARGGSFHDVSSDFEKISRQKSASTGCSIPCTTNTSAVRRAAGSTTPA